MESWIKDLKWDKVVIQFDQESALNKIYEKTKANMGDTVSLRRSPRYSSQSLADGEMVNGLIAGKVRTWLAEVSEKYKIKVGCDSVLFPWIVRHSAWTLARFHVNHSKTTTTTWVRSWHSDRQPWQNTQSKRTRQRPDGFVESMLGRMPCR